ncbi:acyl carrier protein [Halioxenophilus aromaticivorans]|uniref:Acyl carrier protein n=1 Tax=Halioxenophilus aromaticivorans TaxID=1306992 RepID=A0AAV3U033_9ALTE
MTRQELHQQLASTLEELFDTPAAEVTEDAKLYEDLDIDSIDTMDLVLQLKQQKGDKISPELFRDARTVGQVLDILEGL